MKTNYTNDFEKFWRAYPRRTAKGPAFKAWQKNVDEADAFNVKAIIGDLEKRTRLKWWPFDTTKIPHAATWINQQRYLDEGWEDDIKTRGQEQKGATYTERPPEPELPDHGKGHWMSMLNRVMLSYVRMASGFSESMMEMLVTEKNNVHSEILPLATEEINAAKDKSAAKTEMAYLFAETLLNRFDMITGNKYKRRIIDMTKKPA